MRYDLGKSFRRIFADGLMESMKMMNGFVAIVDYLINARSLYTHTFGEFIVSFSIRRCPSEVLVGSLMGVFNLMFREN